MELYRLPVRDTGASLTPLSLGKDGPRGWRLECVLGAMKLHVPVASSPTSCAPEPSAVPNGALFPSPAGLLPPHS